MLSSSISNYPQLNKELAVNRDTGKKHQGEAPSEKLVRKFKENPFLPIGGKLSKNTAVENVFAGCGATTFFLVNGLFKFGRKDSEGSQVAHEMIRNVAETNNFLQRMMRGRIVAQGFTIMALLTGIMVSVSKILPMILLPSLILLPDAEKYLGGTNI